MREETEVQSFNHFELPTGEINKKKQPYCSVLVPEYQRSMLVNDNWPVDVYPKNLEDCKKFSFFADGKELDFCQCIDLVNTVYDDMIEYLKPGLKILNQSFTSVECLEPFESLSKICCMKKSKAVAGPSFTL